MFKFLICIAILIKPLVIFIGLPEEEELKNNITIYKEEYIQVEEDTTKIIEYTEIEDIIEECTENISMENDIIFTDEEINMITNMVRGESGGIIGNVTVTYANGYIITADACVVHKYHAKIVENMYNSPIFPNNVSNCIKQCFSSSYATTNYRTEEQWLHCREDVIIALEGDTDLPNNVFAATCDPNFAKNHKGWSLFAKINWNTGWTSGTFYYYQYNN